jgi:ActR/RegA family two-component response regulator
LNRRNKKIPYHEALAMNSPAPAVVGRVLIVSSDVTTIEQLSESIQRFALFPELCHDVPAALERLQRSKFEAVVVDFRLGSQVGTVVERTRQSASNEHAVVFTVSDGESEAAEGFKAGSTFLLRRPLSAASIDQSIRAAYGLIVRERRRYFRCPVEVPVAILTKSVQSVHGYTINISEGGAAVTVVAALESGDPARLHFALPDDDFQFVFESTVCWSAGQRLGLQFVSPPQIARLQQWLSRRLEETMPQWVRDKFSRVT